MEVKPLETRKSLIDEAKRETGESVKKEPRETKPEKSDDETKQNDSIREAIEEAKRTISALQAKTKEREPRLSENHRVTVRDFGGTKRNRELNQRSARRFSADDYRKSEVKQGVLLLQQTKINSEEPKHIQRQRFEPNRHQNQLDDSKNPKSLVWDCGSSLYDSFELNSFKRQLDSAITASARTLSMPHLPDRRAPPPAPAKKPSSKISRSLQRLLRSVFRSKQSSGSSVMKSSERGREAQYYVVYDTAGALTTIPEVAEMDLCPEIDATVRRTASERFTNSQAMGVSCV